MSDERVHLTAEQALAMLPEGEHIHTFMGGGGMMLGADWSREEAERAIRETDHRELSGQVATAMKHGLCIKHDGRAVFIATIDPDIDPTPWCSGCGAMRKTDCHCGPLAENE